MAEQAELDLKSTAILWLLSEGHSSVEILESHPELDREDVAAAAQLALDIVKRPREAGNYVDAVRKNHPHAYAPWTPESDSELARLHREGSSRAEIARRLGRRPNAIAKRLEKLKTEGALEAGNGAGDSGPEG